MKIKFLSPLLLSVPFLIFSCKDPKKSEDTNPQTVEGSIYIVNEGAFGQANGDISVFNKNTAQVQNELFKTKNGVSPGDVLQSLTFEGNLAYLIMNNSSKAEVVNAATFESSGVISGLSLPRYMVAKDGIGYITEYVSFGGNGRVAIVNLSNNSVTSTISVGSLPEGLLIHKNLLIVCNSGDSTITAINLANQQVEYTHTVIPGPQKAFADRDSFVYVVSGGITDFANSANSKAGGIKRINPENITGNNGTITYLFADNQIYASSFCFDRAAETFYFMYNSAVNKAVRNGSGFSQTTHISRNFYGLGFDESSNQLYAGTYGFNTNETMLRYNQSGNAIDSAEVGIGPNGFVFR